MRSRLILAIVCMVALLVAGEGFATDDMFEQCILRLGELSSIDSNLMVALGDSAPDFTLKTISGDRISLSDFKGKKNVVLSFIPAAWSAVCSEQWPEYNMTQSVFDEYDAVVIGVSVDNVPTLHAWVKQMGKFWFPVASDFWPHGEVAERYGVLRSDGLAERAIFIIDKEGFIRYIEVHDINSLPDFAKLVVALQDMQ